MIPFTNYIGEHIVIASKYFSSPNELSGIRSYDSKIFKFRNQYVLTRALTDSDLKDEDFVPWLESMWAYKETNLKLFLRHRKEYETKTGKEIL